MTQGLRRALVLVGLTVPLLAGSCSGGVDVKGSGGSASGGAGGCGAACSPETDAGVDASDAGCTLDTLPLLIVVNSQ